jgi:hypothetical protein
MYARRSFCLSCFAPASSGPSLRISPEGWKKERRASEIAGAAASLNEDVYATEADAIGLATRTESRFGLGVADAAGPRRVDDPDWIGRLATDELDSTAFAFSLRLAPSYNSDPRPISRPFRDNPFKIAFLL